MFKQSSCEQELAEKMRETLLVKKAEGDTKLKKIAQAVTYLNEAAKLFKESGNQAESTVITQVLEDLVREFKNNLE